jgi:glycolate oxidase
LAKADAMSYTALTEEIIDALSEFLSEGCILLDDESRSIYGRDETEDLIFPPEVVLIPSNTSDVSKIMQVANKHKVPVTVRGAGTGLSGGALSVHGGICLSMERFNKILNIDERNYQVHVEPGVINEILQQAVKEKGLFYPPDPASKGSCFLGGNFAENAGGPKAVKYGVTNEYVLNLEVVLADGSVIWTGANVLKNATGYNLTQLMIGSEGTLGIITKAVLKLIPLPQMDILLSVDFNSAEEACAAVNAIFQEGIVPSGMEFMERDAIVYTLEYLNESETLGEGMEARLLIELDGQDMESLMKDAEKIHEVLERFDVGEIKFADSDKEKERLWFIRRRIGEAVKAKSTYKEEDTVVPRAELPELLRGVKRIGKEYGFKSVCYGHAGDGNLHVNILKDSMAQEVWERDLPKAIDEIFTLCKRLGGTISGEHGIGWVQKDYMPIVFDAVNLKIQRAIKDVFDPDHILNPGKIFPDVK